MGASVVENPYQTNTPYPLHSPRTEHKYVGSGRRGWLCERSSERSVVAGRDMTAGQVLIGDFISDCDWRFMLVLLLS